MFEEFPGNFSVFGVESADQIHGIGRSDHGDAGAGIETPPA
jgi:hypothetical protein